MKLGNFSLVLKPPENSSIIGLKINFHCKSFYKENHVMPALTNFNFIVTCIEDEQAAGTVLF